MKFKLIKITDKLEYDFNWDIIKVNLKDGTSIFLADHNTEFGQCGCCSDYTSKKQVISYEHYEVEN